MLQEICEKSIPVLPNALAHADAAFYRNGRVQQYVPQVLGKYGLITPVTCGCCASQWESAARRCKFSGESMVERLCRHIQGILIESWIVRRQDGKALA